MGMSENGSKDQALSHLKVEFAVKQKKTVNKKALDKTLYDQPFQIQHSFLNFSTAFSPCRRKISSVPTIQTVKGRVVFFRAQREKISTLKPLTVRIFAAAFSPPKTGNRISKPCTPLSSASFQRQNRLHFRGVHCRLLRGFAPRAPDLKQGTECSPYSAGKRVNMEYLPLPQPLFRGWQGFYTPCHQNAFQPSTGRIFSLFLCLLPLNHIAFPCP